MLQPRSSVLSILPLMWLLPATEVSIQSSPPQWYSPPQSYFFILFVSLMSFIIISNYLLNFCVIYILSILTRIVLLWEHSFCLSYSHLYSPSLTKVLIDDKLLISICWVKLMKKIIINKVAEPKPDSNSVSFES